MAKADNSNYKAFNDLIDRLEAVKDAIKKQNYGIAMDILCQPYPEWSIENGSKQKPVEDNFPSFDEAQGTVIVEK